MSDNDNETSFATALVAGGFAGTSVDVALFPIDTLKTRMQSPQGFVKAGGFRGVYNGIGAAAAGSAPGAALFFSSYEVSMMMAVVSVFSLRLRWKGIRKTIYLQMLSKNSVKVYRSTRN